jgi:hypothetical protein
MRFTGPPGSTLRPTTDSKLACCVTKFTQLIRNVVRPAKIPSIFNTGPCAMASTILGSAQHSLPTELVLLVVDQLAGDNQTLCILARASRALQQLAEEQLYKRIEVFTVRDLHNIIAAFTSRSERARAVQTLNLHYHYNNKDLDENTHTRTTFNECIAHMVNLREWHIESPYDNCHWDEGIGPETWVKGDMERFRKALELASTEGPVEAARIQAQRRLGNAVDRSIGLALLESLTIHSHGVEEEFWDLDGFQCLFRHPTLRHLHISCVSITEAYLSLQAYAKTTPLTTLIFDECDITPDSLHAILQTPARLKHLTLGENVWNINRSKRIKPRLTRNPAASLEALSLVAHSLETLVHWDPSWKLDLDSHAPRMSPPGDGMRNFHALKSMQCETTSFLHRAILMNHELAPPNLETLRLSRHWFCPVDLFDHPPDVETYLALPSLHTLELMQSSHCGLDLSTSEYICEAEKARNCHAYAYKLYKAGINLKVLIEMHRDGRLIPPFLHGEPIPIVECLYDAFHRHLPEAYSPKAYADADAAAYDEMYYESYAEQAWDAEHSYGGEDKPAQRETPAVKPTEPVPKPAGPAPETDQLSDNDIFFLSSSTERVLERLKLHFRRSPALGSVLGVGEDVSDDDEYEFDDDMDEQDLDFDVDMEGDDLDVVFHEIDGQLYMEVYETDSEEDEDEEEGADGGEALVGIGADDGDGELD